MLFFDYVRLPFRHFDLIFLQVGAALDKRARADMIGYFLERLVAELVERLFEELLLFERPWLLFLFLRFLRVAHGSEAHSVILRAKATLRTRSCAFSNTVKVVFCRLSTLAHNQEN